MIRLAATVAAAGLMVLVPSTALADPAGPTDFRTVVTSIEPQTDAITVTIEGGDAFVRLVVRPGHEVVVSGYGGEPYLRVNADGTVEENQISPATFYNQARYGGDVPSGVTAESALGRPPQWQTVGTGGTWAWHDHRAHLMSPDPLIGMEPGDELAPQIIELTVNGEPVAVEVVTTLQAPPSRWPARAGFFVGLIAAVAVLIDTRRTATRTRVAVGAMVVASAGLIVGAAQFRSLSPETDPLVTWWLLPALALAASVAAVLVRPALWFGALLALAGLQLLVWGLQRRHVLTRAVLPTDLPYWVDRAVTAAVLPAAGGLVVAGVLTLFVSPKLTLEGPRRSPS
jgi:hypothetical protein